MWTKQCFGSNGEDVEYGSDTFKAFTLGTFPLSGRVGARGLNYWRDINKKYKKGHKRQKFSKSSTYETMKSKLNGRGESLPSGVHWWKRPKSSKHQGRAVMTLSPYTILPDSKGKTYGEGNQASGKHYPIFPQAISG